MKSQSISSSQLVIAERKPRGKKASKVAQEIIQQKAAQPKSPLLKVDPAHRKRLEMREKGDIDFTGLPSFFQILKLLASTLNIASQKKSSLLATSSLPSHLLKPSNTALLRKAFIELQNIPPLSKENEEELPPSTAKQKVTDKCLSLLQKINSALSENEDFSSLDQYLTQKAPRTFKQSVDKVMESQLKNLLNIEEDEDSFSEVVKLHLKEWNKIKNKPISREELLHAAIHTLNQALLSSFIEKSLENAQLPNPDPRYPLVFYKLHPEKGSQHHAPLRSAILSARQNEEHHLLDSVSFSENGPITHESFNEGDHILFYGGSLENAEERLGPFEYSLQFGEDLDETPNMYVEGRNFENDQAIGLRNSIPHSPEPNCIAKCVIIVTCPAPDLSLKENIIKMIRNEKNLVFCIAIQAKNNLQEGTLLTLDYGSTASDNKPNFRATPPPSREAELAKKILPPAPPQEVNPPRRSKRAREEKAIAPALLKKAKSDAPIEVINLVEEEQPWSAKMVDWLHQVDQFLININRIKSSQIEALIAKRPFFSDAECATEQSLHLFHLYILWIEKLLLLQKERGPFNIESIKNAFARSSIVQQYFPKMSTQNCHVMLLQASQFPFFAASPYFYSLWQKAQRIDTLLLTRTFPPPQFFFNPQPRIVNGFLPNFLQPFPQRGVLMGIEPMRNHSPTIEQWLDDFLQEVLVNPHTPKLPQLVQVEPIFYERDRAQLKETEYFILLIRWIKILGSTIHENGSSDFALLQTKLQLDPLIREIYPDQNKCNGALLQARYLYNIDQEPHIFHKARMLENKLYDYLLTGRIFSHSALRAPTYV